MKPFSNHFFFHGNLHDFFGPVIWAHTATKWNRIPCNVSWKQKRFWKVFHGNFQGLLFFYLVGYGQKWHPTKCFFLQKSFRDCWPMTWAETKIDGTPKTGHVRKQISLSIFLNSFFSGAMFGSIRSENETEVPGTFLGNQNQFLKRIGTKWKEQQSTFWTIENLNQLSIFSNFQKLLSCSAVFANLPEILAVCAQKMGPQSLKIFIFGLPSFAECPQFIFGAAIFGRIPR